VIRHEGLILGLEDLELRAHDVVLVLELGLVLGELLDLLLEGRQ